MSWDWSKKDARNNKLDLGYPEEHVTILVV